LKLIFCRFFEWSELVNTRVVNENVESTECFLCFGEEAFDVCGSSNVALDRDCFSAFFCNFVDDLLGAFLLGLVINDDRPVVCSKLLRDCGANAL